MQPGEEQHIQIHVYDEANFHPDALLYLWQRVEASHLTPLVWADGKPMPLNQFIRFYTPGNGRLLFLPTYQPEGTEFSWQSVMGMIWVDEITVGHRAFGHYMFFPEWWGGWPQASIRKTLDTHLFAPPLSLRLILCQGNATNTISLALWKRLGIRIIGEIPNWYKHGDEYHAATVGYILAPEIDILQKKVDDVSKGDVHAELSGGDWGNVGGDTSGDTNSGDDISVPHTR